MQTIGRFCRIAGDGTAGHLKHRVSHNIHAAAVFRGVAGDFTIGHEEAACYMPLLINMTIVNMNTAAGLGGGIVHDFAAMHLKTKLLVRCFTRTAFIGSAALANRYAAAPFSVVIGNLASCHDELCRVRKSNAAAVFNDTEFCAVDFSGLSVPGNSAAIDVNWDTGTNAAALCLITV